MMLYFVKAYLVYDTCSKEWPILYLSQFLYHFLGKQAISCATFHDIVQNSKYLSCEQNREKGKDTHERSDVQTNLVDPR